MGIRETLNKNPQITTGVTLGIIILALIFIVYQSRGGCEPNGGLPSHDFFTVDDGAKYFEDAAEKLPPFDKGGKEAWGAHVVQCGKEPPYVEYVWRYTQQGLEMRKKLEKEGPGAVDPAFINDPSGGREFKAAKSAGPWIKMTSPAFAQLRKDKCKDGSNPKEVIPK